MNDQSPPPGSRPGPNSPPAAQGNAPGAAPPTAPAAPSPFARTGGIPRSSGPGGAGQQAESVGNLPGRPVSQPRLEPGAAGQPISQPGYTAGATRPISQPGYNPGAARPISQPGYNPGAARPISQPGYNPGAARPISQPGYGPAAAQPSSPPPQAAPAQPVAQPRQSTTPGHDPYAAKAPSHAHAVVIGGMRMTVGSQQTFRSESSNAPARPASQPTFDPAANRPTAAPISRPAYDPYAPKPTPSPISRPAYDPYAARPAGAPISRPAYDPFAAAPRPVAPAEQLVAPPTMPQAAPQPAATGSGGAKVDARDADFAHALSSMPGAVRLGPADAQVLAERCARATVRAGQAIVKQGGLAEIAHIFASGAAHMQYTTVDRPPMHCGVVVPGMIIGEGAFDGGGYHGCAVIADADCVVFALSGVQYADLKRTAPNVPRYLRGVVDAQHAAQNKKK